jgi:TolB-like protein/class 3 adenylate cyclase
MSEGGAQNRLSAILAADIAGYTQHVEKDRDGTVASWRAARSDIIDPAIAKYSGRIVKHTGDGFLAEFNTVQSAVECAIAMQGELVSSKLDFRMGIGLGDIVDDGEDIHGEGVNIAARIEALAEQGGVCVSGMVFEAIRNQTEAVFEDLGMHELKHVTEPVKIYQWMKNVDPSEEKTPTKNDVEGKPSIAVLPFDNMSGDPEQEYFADGIAEDLITALAKFHWLLVIARNSSFTYKGSAVNVGEVSRDLGVRYVLEGSVRKAGKRIRVTAQLIEAATGSHIWAERYDRELEDIFEVQDEITQSIVSALAPEFESAEMMRSSQFEYQDLTVWELVMKARWQMGQYETVSNRTAIDLLRKAIDLDNQNSTANSLHAMAIWLRVINGWSDDPENHCAEALSSARRAVLLDNGDASAHASLGAVLTLSGKHDEAIASLKLAVDLNPNFARAFGLMGLAQCFACYFDAAVQSAQKAISLSPRDLDKPFWIGALSFTAFARGDYEETLEWTAAMLREKPDIPTALRHRAIALVCLGRESEARESMDREIELSPGMTLGHIQRVFSIGDPEVERRWLDALRKAGLPE